MLGVNLSGAESGLYSNSYVAGVDYVYPTADELDYYQSKGIDLIRLPFSWEAMQPTLDGPLNTDELARMTDFLDAAAARGIQVIIDAHGYARYDEQPIGSADVPISAFADFWSKLATALNGHPAVAGYDLMNEPHDLGSPDVWPQAAQAAVDAIRAVDMQTAIFVEGDQYASAPEWQEYNGNLLIHDPADNIVYEAHLYFDRTGSGIYSSYDDEGAYPQMGSVLLAPFVEWLQENHVKGFIGEFSIPGDDPRWLPVLDNFLQEMAADGLSGTYWGAGPLSPWLNFSVEPLDGQDKPQMAVLSDQAEAQQSIPLAQDVVNADAPFVPTAYGTAGDDVLQGGLGGYRLVGGTGDDTYVVDTWGDQIVENANEGTDTVLLRVDRHTLEDNVENGVVQYASGARLTGNSLDNLLTGGPGDDTLDGADGNDQLAGGDGNDILLGGAGDDQIRGDAGNDTANGGDGNDTISGGSGNDVLTGDAGDDTLTGDDGDDVVNGGIGNDHLEGNAGNDNLSGNEGNDTLDGGTGNDALSGGSGDDILTGGPGNDVI